MNYEQSTSLMAMTKTEVTHKPIAISWTSSYGRVKQWYLSNRQLNWNSDGSMDRRRETTHGPPYSMTRSMGATIWQQRLHLLMSLFILLPWLTLSVLRLYWITTHHIHWPL